MGSRLTIVLWLAGLLGLLSRATAHDIDTNKPYLAQVYVRLPTDLTPEQRAAFWTDLRVSLKTAIPAELCRYQIQTEFPAEPTGILKSLLDSIHPTGTDKLTGIKTHLLSITRNNGTFQITSVQHDGDTGLLSPRRSELTDDVDRLGRLSASLALKNQGITGSMTRLTTDRHQVLVRFRGGTLAGFKTLLEPDLIFAVSEVTNAAQPAGRARPMTYLRVVGPLIDGAARCEILSSLAQPLQEVSGQIIGYRCHALTTIRGELKLDFRDVKTNQLVDPKLLETWADERSFLNTPGPRDRLIVKDNRLTSLRPYQNVALVSVRLTAGRTAPFVIPVIDDKPVSLNLQLTEAEIATARHERQCEALEREASSLIQNQASQFRKISELISGGKQEEAHRLGVRMMSDTQQSLDQMRQTILMLRKVKQGSYSSKLLDLANGKLDRIDMEKQALEKFVVQLKEIITAKNDPKRIANEFQARLLVQEIQDHVQAGQIDKALSLYDQLLKLTPQDDVRKNRANLEAEWKTRGPGHTTARKWLAEWGSTTSLGGYLELGEQLTMSIDTLILEKDRLALRRFVSSMSTVSRRIDEQIQHLTPDVLAERTQLAKARELVTQLKSQETRAREAIRTIETGDK